MVARAPASQLVLALCLVAAALAQSNSNNPTRGGEAIEANVQFLQGVGLSQQEARLLSDSAATPGAEIPILEDVRDGPWHDGSYYFRYTSADGSTREEGGIPTAPCTMRVTGSYSYIAPNADVIDMQYVADETGYKAFPSGTRPDLYTAPVRVPEPIYPAGYFDGIPCPGDEFNQGGQPQPAPTSPVRPPNPARPVTGTGRPLNGNNQGRPTPTFGGGQSRPTRAPLPQTRPTRVPVTPRRPINGGQTRPTRVPVTPRRPINGGQTRPITFRPRPTPSQGDFGGRLPTNTSPGITTPEAGFKTPTSFITAAATNNFKVQNNYNNGGTTTNDGYSYTEPPTSFNPGNTVTTDFSAGPQTTAIEPLTQLYESPNY